MSQGDLHMNGDCWPSQCHICITEDAIEEANRVDFGEDE